MGEKLPINKYLEYFIKPIGDDELRVLNIENNIELLLIDVYRDFIISLIDLIDTTYLGDELVIGAHQTEHFNWCWVKVIGDFKKEHINFNLNGTHKDFFFNYITEQYYENAEKESSGFIKSVMKFWNSRMSHTTIKTKSEYDFFIDVYKNLDRNLKISKHA